MAGKRCGSAEKIRRRIKVETWMADGAGRHEIFRNVAKEKWGISLSQVDEYMLEIRKEWMEYCKSESPYIYAEAIKIRKRLYLRALQKKDLRTALSIMDSLDKIRGILKELSEQKNINFDAEKLDPETRARLEKEIGYIFEDGNEKKS